ncbi:U32 family peptidase [Sedimentitalea sp. HM32M-2]|uniref:ubiquinone anaerobic biosynthesis protein UbiV n=1 Tax=Sedimentitalea sp. HM32M-2 TaxID=3351566 RepID=UPI00364431FF
MAAKLTLGPILYHWEAEAKRDFYARIADEAPVDIVYLGEVICSKRTPFFDRHMPEVIDRLERGGKQVVLASLSEVVIKRERNMMRDFCAIDSHEIELNNTAGLQQIDGRPHRIGPLMNTYNEQTLRWLVNKGATHVTLPVELPRAVVGHMARAAAELGVGAEVQVFGRASLALSARCYHARAHCRTKDNCQFVCEEDPDGMPLTTVTGQPFLTINGIQTLSQSYVNLAAQIDEMTAMGIGHFRIMPQMADMVAVARIFADRIAGRRSGSETAQALAALDLQPPLSDGFWHGREGHRQFGPKVA